MEAPNPATMQLNRRQTEVGRERYEDNARALTLKGSRVPIAVGGLAAIVCLLVASFLPNWLAISGPQDEGFGSAHLGVYTSKIGGQFWTNEALVEKCEAGLAPDAVGARGCSVASAVLGVAKKTFVANFLCMVVFSSGLIQLMVNRVRAAVLLFSASIGMSTFASSTFLYQANRIAVQIGYVERRSAEGVALLWVALGFAAATLVFVIFLHREDRHGESARGGFRRAVHGLLPVGHNQDAAYAPAYDRDVHACGLGVCYEVTESGLLDQARTPLQWLYAAGHFLLTVPVHFVKTYDWAPVRMNWYGPPSETACVERYGVKSKVVTNYMIYRRSNIISIVAFAVPLFLYKLSLVQEEYQAMAQTDTKRVSFEQYQLQFAEVHEPAYMLGNFTAHTGDKVSTAFFAGYRYGEFMKLVIATAALGFATVLGAICMHRWHRFKTTRLLLLLGWIVLVSIPLVKGLVGYVEYNDYSQANLLIRGYAADMRIHFGVEELVRTCVDTDMPAMLRTVQSKLQWCDKIPQHTVDLRPLWGIWDARPIHEMCRKVRAVVELDFTMASAEASHNACFAFAKVLDLDFAKQPGLEAPAEEVLPVPSQMRNKLTPTVQGCACIGGVDVDGSRYEDCGPHLSGRPGRAWCQTQAQCGTWSLRQRAYYDYCFPVGDDEDQVATVDPSCACASECTRTAAASSTGGQYTCRTASPNCPSTQPCLPPLGFSGVLNTPFLYNLGGTSDGNGGLRGYPVRVYEPRVELRAGELLTVGGSVELGVGEGLRLVSNCKRLGTAHLESEDAGLRRGDADGDGALGSAPRAATTESSCLCRADASGYEGSAETSAPEDVCELHGSSGKYWCLVVDEYADEPEALTVLGNGTVDAGAAGAACGHFSFYHRMQYDFCTPPMHASNEDEFEVVRAGAHEVSWTLFTDVGCSAELEMWATSAAGTYAWAPLAPQRLHHDPPQQSVLQVSLPPPRRAAVVRAAVDEVGLVSGGPLVTRERSRPDGRVVLTEDLPETSFAEPSSNPTSEERRSDPLESQPAVLGGVDIQCVEDVAITCRWETYLAYTPWRENTCGPLDAVCGDRSVCVCKKGYCWSWSDTKCIPEGDLQAQQLAQRRTGWKSLKNRYAGLEDWGFFWDEEGLPESERVQRKKRLQDQASKLVDGVEHGAGILVSAFQGVLNLIEIVNMVVAVGPGFVISALTAKLIFAHSAVPGRFIQVFPIFFCPAVFTLFSLLMQVVRDDAFNATMLVYSFWPLGVALAATYHGFHLPMTDERVQFMANYMLVAYYFWVILFYVFIGVFVLFRTEEGQGSGVLEWIDNKPKEALMNSLSSRSTGDWLVLAAENFTLYFYSCCAITDMFITLIVEEHFYAYHEVTAGVGQSSERSPDAMVAKLHLTEQTVVEGWLVLLENGKPQPLWVPQAVRESAEHVEQSESAVFEDAPRE